MSPSAAVIENHLNAASTLEGWLRSYPDWVRELRDPDRGLRAAMSQGIPAPTGKVSRPVEDTATRMTELAMRVEAIENGLAQLDDEMREAIEVHYFDGISVRRKLRHAALAQLLDYLISAGVLTSCNA